MHPADCVNVRLWQATAFVSFAIVILNRFTFLLSIFGFNSSEIFFLTDVFHWECLNDQQAALPNNTAPGGRVCPSCSSHIFPPSNLVSPVADVLRNRLREVTWGQDEFTLNLVNSII